MPLNTNPVIGYGAGLYVADWPVGGVVTSNVIANATGMVEIPQILEVTPEGTTFGNVRETHVKSPDVHHQNGAGWGDPRTVQFRQHYNERNKAFLFSLDPRNYIPPLGLPPVGVPIPRGGKAPNGVTYTQADAPLVNLDLYLWIRVYPDGSKIGFIGYLQEHGESNINTDDNTVETTGTIQVSGKPLFVQVP